jgi:hypothetical protein
MAMALEETCSSHYSDGDMSPGDANTGDFGNNEPFLDAEKLRKLEQQRQWEIIGVPLAETDVEDSPVKVASDNIIKFERVSSAIAGDEDFVPMVDYTKNKSQILDAADANKVNSRLHYHEKVKRRRRKRIRRVLVVLGLVAVISFYKLSTTDDNLSQEIATDEVGTEPVLGTSLVSKEVLENETPLSTVSAGEGTDADDAIVKSGAGRIVPKACWVPFSHLTDPNCRKLSKEMPLVDIESIIFDGMLQ